MKMQIYQVDAFASKAFTGNPAAVVPLKQWISESLMQQIAAENNLAETAFIVQEKDHYAIRWFTPETEVPLCGHATLASAYVIFTELNYPRADIHFMSKSGPLTTSRNKDWLTLNFPAMPVRSAEKETRFQDAFGVAPTEVQKSDGGYVLLVFEDEDIIHSLSPNYSQIIEWEEKAIIVSAPSVKYDFVSRLFAPKVGINEDPVTGSAHTRLIPYWSKKLNKKQLLAKQVSNRGGILKCVDLGDRVEMSGQAVLYLKGEIEV